MDDPARGQVSDQAIWKHTRGQLDRLPEDERPVNCTHSVRYGGLQNCQTNELTAEQQDKQGGWDPIQRTMKDRYTISIHDRDACLRVSGQVPKNGEPPQQHQQLGAILFQMMQRHECRQCDGCARRHADTTRGGHSPGRAHVTSPLQFPHQCE